jgi:hypothetical protein
MMMEAPTHLRGGGGLIMELDVHNATQAARFAVELERYERVELSCDLVGRKRFITAVTAAG